MKSFLNRSVFLCIGLNALPSAALPFLTVTGSGYARGTNQPGAKKSADEDAHANCGAQLAQRVTIYTCYGFLGQMSCSAEYRCVNDLRQPLGFDPDKTIETVGMVKDGTSEDARADFFAKAKKLCGYRPVVQVTDLKCRTTGVTDTYAECRGYYFCK